MLGLNMSGLLPDHAPLLAATATLAAPCSNMADQLRVLHVRACAGGVIIFLILAGILPLTFVAMVGAALACTVLLPAHMGSRGACHAPMRAHCLPMWPAHGVKAAVFIPFC